MSARASTLALVSAFFALYVIWGSTYLAIGIGVQSWPPLLMAGTRFVLAGALLLAVACIQGAPWPTALQWRNSLLLGTLLLVGGNGGVSVAQSLGVASGVAALAVATVPLFTLLLGLYFGQRARGIEWLGIAIGMFGMLLLNLGGHLQGSRLAAALLVLAAASWAFGSVLGRRLDVPQGISAAGAQMLCAGLVLLPISWLLGERMSTWPSLSGWLALGYLTVFGSIIAFSAYLYLLKHVRPAAATSYAYVNPVVAVLLGVSFAGERLYPQEWAALLIIVLAVVLISLPQWRGR